MKTRLLSLAGVAQLVGAWSHKPKGRGFDSQEGTGLGRRFGTQGTQSGCTQEGT